MFFSLNRFLEPETTVREEFLPPKLPDLRQKLNAKAKREPGFRFHSLDGHVCRSEVLRAAWMQVRANRGAPEIGFRLFLCAVFVGAVAGPVAAAGFRAPPALHRLCYDCHGDGANKGSFALDELVAKGPVEAQRSTWLKVWRNVRHEFMPPAHATEEMTPAERREVARWIEQAVFGVDPRRIDPGAVTIRRLNREEYQHTVNDLFGTEFELREQLLPDDTAHGFDNIGDAQTLSPVQFVRYLDLAEWIVGQVVVDSGPPLPRIAFDALGPKKRGGLSRKPLTAKSGVIEQRFPVELKQDGRFQIDLTLGIGGWHDFGGDIHLSIDVDDARAAEHTVPLGGDAEYHHAWEFTCTKGSHTLVLRAKLEAKPAAPPNPALVATEEPAPVRVVEDAPADRDAPDRAKRPGRPRRLPPPPELKFRKLELAVTGPLEAGIFGEYPEPHRRLFFRGAAPHEAAARRSYATEILRRVADRAFHRPVDEPALAQLVDLALQDDNFERGIGSALAAILSSSRFLFREEPLLQSATARVTNPLDDHALASRLSYLLWLSLPDDELNALAAAGKLRSNLAAQVRRMLADGKSERFFRDFTGQWLRTRNVLMTAITPGEVSDKLNPVREPMKVETDMLFEHIARYDRDLIELITADYTFLNEPLAKYYGIPDVIGDEMRKVALSAGSRRGGVLTHGSILVSTSNPNRTSPVKRGVFVLENILGTPPPPPPAAVPDLEEAKTKGGGRETLRAQLAAHRADRACAACHAHFDPIGLALENFSYIGQWRDHDGEEPIDAGGEMVTGETFKDFTELRMLIAQRKDKFYRCVCEKLMTYALGRGLEPHDAPTVDAITDRLLADGGKFSTLLMSVIESPAFLMRRGER